jgi:hypothetical protein
MRFRFNEAMLNYYTKHRGLDAQQCGEALSKIGHGNVVAATPEEIVVAATPRKSPLHNGFDWNQAEAAHNWRLAQARHLVAAIITVVPDREGNDHETRAFMSVRGKEGFQYHRIDRIMGDADLRVQVVRDALDDWRIFQRRYMSLKDVLGDLGQIERALVRELSRLASGEQRAA